jgi:hypothetical protein
MDTRGVLDHNGEQDTLNCMFRFDNTKAFRKLLGLQIDVEKVLLPENCAYAKTWHFLAWYKSSVELQFDVNKILLFREKPTARYESQVSEAASRFR